MNIWFIGFAISAFLLIRNIPKSTASNITDAAKEGADSLIKSARIIGTELSRKHLSVDDVNTQIAHLEAKIKKMEEAEKAAASTTKGYEELP